MSARWTADHGLSRALTATITTGKTRRMPKTAITMPTVRKIFCQKALIFFRIPALITALSKDSEISSTARMATRPKAVHPSYSTPATRPAAVTAKAQRNVFNSTG